MACPALRELVVRGRDEVAGVVTQPERPSGRRLELTACPVQELAQSLELPVLKPETIADPAVLQQLAGFQPDVAIVADYGQFLPAVLLSVPSKGTLNIHPSLLPKYRGAAPVQWAVARGEVATGVTILYVTEKMDAGGILAQEQVPIREDDTAASLTPLLAQLGASLLLRVLDEIREGRATARPQDESQVTMAPRLKKEDGRLDWTLSAVALRNRIRGFTPWPGCFTEWGGKRLRLHRVRVEAVASEPGVVLEVGESGPLVACGEGSLRWVEVQPEGGRAMDGAAFARGHHLKPGDRMG